MNAQNVLLVDDQPLIRKSLRSILESIDENLIIIAAGVGGATGGILGRSEPLWQFGPPWLRSLRFSPRG